MRIGVDLDDVIAECAVPYLRRFAEEFHVELPPEPGWHTLDEISEVSQADKDRFRRRTYDGTFFGELEMYADAPAVLERLVAAGHEIYFVTARAERRRVVTETWLRDKGILDHAKAVHLRPQGDFSPTRTLGRYDPTGSARYKVRLAEELELQAFCEDDRLISQELGKRGIRVFLFDHPWNRDVEGPSIERVTGWGDVAQKLGI
ncbi:MAG: hypothetical protein KGN00_00620 [Chloroflexota bacterium]|nr:hypothetical protein [Chloroflexota bacterium]MDE3192162.1 hypothetical protein [Chloroflexota bacterium]